MYSHPTIVRIVLSSLFSTLFLLTTLVPLRSQAVEVSSTPTFPNLPLNNARITKMEFTPDGSNRYHGQQFPELEGWYIYGDLSTGQIWGLSDDGKGTITNIELINTDHLITTFGLDNEGEIYYGTLGQGIYKLQ